MAAFFSSNPEIIYIGLTLFVCYFARLSVRLKHIKYVFFACAVFFIGTVVAYNSPASHEISEIIWRVLHATSLGVLCVACFFLFRHLAINENNNNNNSERL